MVFGIKKKDQKIKNQTRKYVDGKAVINKLPELEIPVPPPDNTAVNEKPLLAEDVYEEGRSVGFQQGMIYSLELIDDHLKQYQATLKKKIEEQQKEVSE